MSSIRATSQPAGQTAARAGVLVGPQWLGDHLADPAVVVVEVDVSRTAYDRWHIPGAVLWNIYADLKDAGYQLAGERETGRIISASGIGAQTTVVLYGYGPCLGFWLLKLHGHDDVRILDCSRDNWEREDRPRARAGARAAATGYRPGRPPTRLRAGQAAVRDAIASEATTLADVRSESEFKGERFWPSGGMEPGGRAGHVPGAVHQPLDGLYDDRGAFRGTSDLRQVFAGLDLDSDSEVITYCTIGGRAATAWFVLTYLLGRQNVRVYDGSWADWGKAPGVPVQAG
jgi:thiosulfate/3-mercaptopyruvate sulfurtransferase